jgi:RNA polymerase primary sigma factor
MYIRSTENEANDYIQSVLKRSREIGKKGRPDRKRERALIAAAQAGDDSAMEYLLVCHALFVQSIVLKFRHRGAEIDDLWSCGMDGLRHAITRYDLEKHHVKLVSMAVWWIRQRIEYEIADNFNVIRVPIDCGPGVFAMRKFLDANHKGTFDDFMGEHRLRISRSRAADLWAMCMKPCSLNKEYDGLGEGNPMEAQDSIVDRSTGDPDEFDISDYVHRLMDQALTPREIKIVTETVLNERTLDSVGHEIKTSRERVRQIRNRALLKMATRASNLEAACESRRMGRMPLALSKHMPPKVVNDAVCEGDLQARLAW